MWGQLLGTHSGRRDLYMGLSGRNFAVWVLLCVFLVSCGNNKPKDALIKINSFSIKGVFSKNPMLCFDKDQLGLWYRASAHSLYFMDCQTGSVTDSMDYPPGLDDRAEIFVGKGRILYVTEKNSNLIIQYKDGIPRRQFFWNDQSKGLQILHRKFEISDDFYYFGDFTPMLSIPKDRKEYFDIDPILYCKLQDSSIKSIVTLGTFPGEYKGDDLYWDFGPRSALVSDSQLAYMYDINPIIYIYKVIRKM